MNTNYVAIITSKWHLYGLESFLLNIKINSADKISIYVMYHKPSNRFRIEDEDFYLRYKYDLRIKYVKDFNDIINDIKYTSNENKNYKIINPMEPSLRLYYRLKKLNIRNKVNYIIIDEGLGNYVSEDIFNKMANIKNEDSYLELKSIKRFFNKLVLKLLKNVERRTLFSKKKNKLILNIEVADSLKVYFNEIKSEKYILSDINRKSILIVSDNISNICRKNDFESIQYKSICKFLKDNFKGYDIYLKPHPNEMKCLEKFKEMEDIKLLDTNLSFENLINNNDFEYVLGFSSTALITCANIFNKKCYSINQLLDKELLSEFGISYVNNFIRLSKMFNIDII